MVFCFGSPSKMNKAAEESFDIFGDMFSSYNNKWRTFPWGYEEMTLRGQGHRTEIGEDLVGCMFLAKL